MPVKIAPKPVAGSTFLTLSAASVCRLTRIFVYVSRPSSTALFAPFLQSRTGIKSEFHHTIKNKQAGQRPPLSVFDMTRPGQIGSALSSLVP